MKKVRTIIGITAAVAAAVSMTACDGSGQYGDTTKNIEIAAKDYNGFYKNAARVYRDYVKVGDYKELEVAKIDRSGEEISDEDVEKTLKSLAEEYKEDVDITEDGITQNDDKIVMDYKGSVNGKEFEGGSAENHNYTIGSRAFIEDFDTGLVGKEADKDYDLKVKFPDDYQKEELKGKEAIFKVKIKSILRPTAPEINDEFAAAHTNDWELKGYGSGIKTLDKLKEGIKSNLAESQKSANDQQLYGDALSKIIENSEFKEELPQDEVSYLADTIKSNAQSEYESYGESSGAESFEDYLKKSYGFESEADYDEHIHTQATEYLKSKMVTMIIAADNGIKVSAEEITKEGNSIALNYGFESYQKLVEQYGQIINADMGYMVIYKKVSTIIADSVKQVETTSADTEPSVQIDDGHDHDHDHDHEEDTTQESTEKK